MATGQQRGESAEKSWRGSTDRGSQHRTPETVAEKRGSSHGEEDRLKMSAFKLLVEFSLVTHASDSPLMHVVLQYLLLLLVNPKLCSCLFVCFIFSCLPRSYSCVAVKKWCVTPSATSWSPAAQEEKVREEDECVWGWGRNVTKHWGFGNLKKKTVSWDSSLEEGSRIFSWGLRNVSRVCWRNYLSLLMSKNLKLKKVNKSFVPEPISTVFGFLYAYEHYEHLWTFVNVFRICMNMSTSHIHILVVFLDLYITLVPLRFFSEDGFGIK